MLYLAQTGVVNEETWNVIVDRFLGIDQTVLSNPDFFPYQSPSGETVEPETLQEYLATTRDSSPAFPWCWAPQTATKKGATHAPPPLSRSFSAGL